MSNVLPVSPRPAGSGRPNRDRVLTSIYLDREDSEALQRAADEFGVQKSEVHRLALKAGIGAARSQLRKERSS